MNEIVAAFVGCFAAMLVFAELGRIQNKLLVCGAIIAFLLGMLLAWVLALGIKL